jgi:hypothetical protein
MKTYKIIFAGNAIMLCRKIELNINVEMKGKFICEQRNGEVMYALVRAETETEACTIARQVIDITDKIFGSVLI